MPNDLPMRTLSMIAEDIGENEAGSFSLKGGILGKEAQGQSTFKKQIKNLNQVPIKVDEVDEEDTDQQPTVDEQDEFLFESYFSEKKNSASFQETEVVEPEDPEPTTPKKGKSKWSMSTDVKSSAGSGNLVNILNPNAEAKHNIDAKSLKYMNHKFDEQLYRTQGEVICIMRVCDSSLLLDKFLTMFKGLADQIKLSLDQI